MQLVLALEVVTDGGLINASLRRQGADVGGVILILLRELARSGGELLRAGLARRLLFESTHPDWLAARDVCELKSARLFQSAGGRVVFVISRFDVALKL